MEGCTQSFKKPTVQSPASPPKKHVGCVAIEVWHLCSCVHASGLLFLCGKLWLSTVRRPRPQQKLTTRAILVFHGLTLTSNIFCTAFVTLFHCFVSPMSMLRCPLSQRTHCGGVAWVLCGSCHGPLCWRWLGVLVARFLDCGNRWMVLACCGHTNIAVLKNWWLCTMMLYLKVTPYFPSHQFQSLWFKARGKWSPSKWSTLCWPPCMIERAAK